MCPPCIAKFWPSLYDKHTYIILAMNKAEDVLGHHVFQKYPRLCSYHFWICKSVALCLFSFSGTAENFDCSSNGLSKCHETMRPQQSQDQMHLTYEKTNVT